MIALDQLETGAIYRLDSRNLGVGVYDGDGGFVGIRTKFDSRFLFKEFHWDDETKMPYCTVRPIEEIAHLPEDISISERADPPSICLKCEKAAWWTGPPVPAPWACEGGCDKTEPRSNPNKALFEFLEAIEEIEKEENSEYS